MHCPSLAELPPPPPGKTGWPWTEESAPFPPVQPNGAPWPKIGVVTPSFNQADYLEQSIRSILLQGYPDLDYVIIDGGSTDQSTAVIRKYERWLSYWVSERDRGCADASAKGLARTDAGLLGVMNADDFFAQNAFAKLLVLRQANPHHVLWAGAAPELDLSGKQIQMQQPYIRDQQSIGHWGVGAWFFSPACLFDGATYRTVGGFDPRFYNIGDVELWIRMGKIGNFVCTAETVAFIHHDPGSVSRRDKISNDLALIAANYLHGNQEIAGLRMTIGIKRWLRTLNKNQSLAPETAADILALVPPSILAKAFVQSVNAAARRSIRRIFPR